MDIRYLPDQETYQRMTTQELRKAFVADRLFIPGAVSLVYCDTDRAILGGAIPEKTPLPLLASRREMAAEYFAERREIGVVNIGGQGTIRTGTSEFPLAHKDMLYIGRGVRIIELMSADPLRPAVFYIVSFPAHAEYPTTLVRAKDASPTPLGTPEGANKRTIYKYIHQQGARSCQLVMGVTDVEPGSIWNTMPPHTHQRRMEAYLYFGLGADGAVIHLMGKPRETRSLVLRNTEAVISPGWSVHCGAGTSSYSFVWAMGGENQDFNDMDGVAIKDLL